MDTNEVGHGWDGQRFSGEFILDERTVVERLRGTDGPYVYVLCRPDLRPFYVGKGVGNRVLHHLAEARNTKRLTHKLNIIRSIERSKGQLRYIVEAPFASEAASLARERELIALIGRYDLRAGPLTNQTDGGEGTSNPSEESRQRRRESLWGSEGDDEDKNLANTWFQEIKTVRSVPVKVLGEYKVEGIWQNRDRFRMSDRQAAALAASAIANRITLCPGARIPRRMEVNGVGLIVENGVGRDVLSSGMATLTDDAEGNEVLSITPAGFAFLLAALDSDLLISAGVVDPSE